MRANIAFHLTAKILTLTVLVACILTSTPALANPSKEVVKIKGEAIGLADAKKVYLQRYYNKMFFVIDSAVITNGRFLFSTVVPVPELYSVTADTTLITPLYVFIDDTREINIKIDTARGGRNTIVTGSKATDRYKTYLSNARNMNIENFIREDPASIVSAFVLYRYFSPSLPADEISKYTAMLHKSLSGTQ
ncbi:MAG: DUF4369 domain-containing protein, partial [Moraxellaceae bacterium]